MSSAARHARNCVLLARVSSSMRTSITCTMPSSGACSRHAAIFRPLCMRLAMCLLRRSFDDGRQPLECACERLWRCVGVRRRRVVVHGNILGVLLTLFNVVSDELQTCAFVHTSSDLNEPCCAPTPYQVGAQPAAFSA